MSSILRALKKIEKITPRPEESQIWPRPIDAKKAVNSRVKKKWLYHKFVSIVGIILAIVVIAWLAASQRHFIKAKLFPDNAQGVSQQPGASSKQKPPVYQAKIEKNPSESEGVSQKPSALQDKPSVTPSFKKKSMKFSSQRSLPDQQPMGKTRTSQAAVYPSSGEKDTALPHTTFPQQLDPQPEVSVSAEVPVQKAPPTRAITPPQKRSAAKNSFAALPRFTDSTLKLQAIAWSYEATQRLAVINNRIVHEGESVDGYSIIQIRQEDVIVNDGTESWRLEFTLAQ
ncbi:MAG: hypothetical protein JSV83_24025 [Desulfobacterales bacterium]|nr:MAG: hypothetical protein JSV83_24025 [Desulfobacterales bacterium]